MERIDNLPRCPRCEVAWRPQPGTGTPSLDPAFTEGGALEVCDECAQREFVGRMLYGAPIVGYSEWPLTIDDLLAEDRDRYTWARNAVVFAATDADGEP